MSKTRTEPKSASGAERPRPGSTPDFIWENTKTILIAFLMAIVIKTSLVEAYKIPSASMEDTLLVGDFLLANKFVYGARVPFVNWRLPAVSEPEQGDVFIFVFPGASDKPINYIKRCVAGPGQTVQIIDKALYVDGERFEDPDHSKFTNPFVKPNRRPHPRGEDWRSGGQPDNFGPYVVPEGYFFAMGDNRDNSYDSRFWGPVPRENILGKAMIIHWSWKPDQASPEVSVADPLSVPRLFLYNAAHFFERVRWSRLFNVIE
ncbi:MAG TPA: signal peptidase I [candidate division Zixibacteria bacterium]|nr:signal peptidase I [candidate division Zixibacteria bacterium]